MNLGQNTTLKPGINQVYLHEITIDNGSYGKQMVLSVAKVPESKKDEKTIVNKLWLSFKKSFPEDKSFGFRLKLEQYADFISAFVPNGQEVYDSVYEEMSTVNFDNTSDESVQNFEALFVEKLLSHLPKNLGEIPVKAVFHYGTFKNGNYYLSLAKYKENGFNLPIGKNPAVGPNLILTKPLQKEEEVAEIDSSHDSGESLPF